METIREVNETMNTGLIDQLAEQVAREVREGYSPCRWEGIVILKIDGIKRELYRKTMEMLVNDRVAPGRVPRGQEGDPVRSVWGEPDP